MKKLLILIIILMLGYSLLKDSDPKDKAQKYYNRTGDIEKTLRMFPSVKKEDIKL